MTGTTQGMVSDITSLAALSRRNGTRGPQKGTGILRLPMTGTVPCSKNRTESVA